MRVAVIGHVEWTRIAQVKHIPASGDIVHAHPVWDGPAGGGAVAAVQLAKLAGSCVFFTALGDDPVGRWACQVLEDQNVEVVAAVRCQPTRGAVSLVDASGERTTITLGERLQPSSKDALPWRTLESFDAIYFAAGDAALLQQARAARKLVVTCRELTTVAEAAVSLDALVGSVRDPAERYDPTQLAAPPILMVSTDGAAGGNYSIHGGDVLTYPAEPPPGPILDTYGVGDSFAAALAFGLAVSQDIREALLLAARCGAACTAGRGPFAGQLSLVAQLNGKAIKQGS